MKFYRSRLLISIIAVLVLALALAACGGGEEPTPTPEPPPPTEPAAEPTDAPEPTDEPAPTEVPTEEPAPTEEPEPTAEPAPAVDFQEFDSDEAGLTMSFPADWVSDTTFPEFLVFASSQEALEANEPGATDGVALVLHGAAEDFNSDDPVAILEEFIPEFDFGGEGVRGEITETTINGAPGATAIVDGESDSGAPLTAYIVVIIDGDWAAILVGASSSEAEDEFLDTFSAMAETIALREPVMAEGDTDSGEMAELPETEGFLLYGDVLDVTLSEDGIDTWDFIGLEGEVIDLIVEPANDDLDVVIDILNDSGESVLEFPLDDSFGTEELIGFEIPASTTYYIVVESFGGNAGDYKLTLAESGNLPVTEETEDIDETGDVAETAEESEAVPLASGGVLEMSGIYVSSVDGAESATFTFMGKAGEFADVSVSPQSDELDVVIDLLDPSGTSLLDEPVDDSFDNEYIRVQRMPEDGEYTVVVTSYDGTPGDFELLVEESYLSDPASFIFASDTIEDAEDAHDFPFYTYQDELVVVQVDPDIEFDAMIQLFNDDTEELLEEEDASTGFEEIVFFVPEDGNYSFRVIGYDGSTGDYDITLIGSEYVYFELAVGDLVNGRFGESNLFEYYIGGTPGDTVNFTIKTDDEIDLMLELVDFDDNVLASADDGFTGDDETMTYTFEEDTLLILRVSDFTESGAGEFILSVD